VNTCLLQTLDGMSVNEEDEDTKHPSCTACGARIKEGSEVIAHTYLDERWHTESVYCDECYPQTTVSFTEGREEAIIEARIATRSDCATQSRYHILHTRGGYGVLRHSEGEGKGEEEETDPEGTDREYTRRETQR
jgi:hypothetical protein